MKKLTFLLALFCIYTTSYAQHAYFNTTKDDIIIRVGYVPNMDRPAYIHYREE